MDSTPFKGVTDILIVGAIHVSYSYAEGVRCNVVEVGIGAPTQVDLPKFSGQGAKQAR